jgi:O-antigen ligase
MIVMCTTPIFPLLYAPLRPTDEEVPWLRLLWLPVYAGTVFYAAWNYRLLYRALPALIPTAALLIYALASAAWSIAPDITLRRFEALAFNGLLSFYLAARFSWRGLIEIVATAALLLAVGTVVMCLAFPSVGIHQTVNAGAWRGLWIEKNQMGFTMAAGAQAAAAAALVNPARRRLWFGVAALCSGLVLLSRSGTSLLCLVGGLGVIIGLSTARRGPVLAVAVAFAAGSCALAALFLIVLDLPLALSLIGKDPTLTGRTDIWASVARRIAERPVLGYGYAAFWHDPQGPARLVRIEAQWDVPSAHNGWLELLLQLGWAGATLAAGYVVLTLVMIGRRLRERNDGYWALAFVASVMVSSLSESQIERQNDLVWMLFTAISIKLLLDLLPDAAAKGAPRSAGRRPAAALPARG